MYGSNGLVSIQNTNDMKRKLFDFILIYGSVIVVILAKTETTTIRQWHRKYAVPNETLDTMPRMATPCETPNNDPGYCLEIQKCSHLYLQLNNTEAVDFLRASRCGPPNEDRQRPKVCCGKFNNFVDRLHETQRNNPLPKNCGVQNYTLRSRIFGGVEADLGEFPWMARLIHKNRYGYRTFGCSGFLIHSKYVLTAAHCLESKNIKIVGPVFEVQLGEHNTETLIDCNQDNSICAPKPQKARVLDLIVHPNYDKDSKHFHYDIGLVHLKKGMSFNDYIYPICLLENPLFQPFEYWISGWGKTEDDHYSVVKLKVSLPPYSWEECSYKYANVQINLSPSQICAGGQKNRDSCIGDSGGPLMVVENGNHWSAAGIVSYGIGCGNKNWPGVYTNITSYIEWIKQEMIKHSVKRERRENSTKI